MDAIALKTFAAVLRCGSVSQAASELHTVQSNVTARIKRLEEELGVRLFVRHSRGVFATAAGERPLVYSQQFSVLEEELRAALRDDGEVRGPLRLGTMETTAAVRLPAVLKRFHKTHPGVQLEVRTGTTAEMLEQVLAHKLDGAFVAGPIDHPELTGGPTFAEELVLVRAAHSPDIAQRLLDGHLTVIVFRLGCSYRQAMEAAFVSRGWLPYQRLEFGTLDGILGCVAADVGVAVLPRSAVEAFGRGKGLQAQVLGRKGLIVETWFVRRTDAHRRAALTAFESLLA
jgi:DNA-binding transcriptional LysR family regulator